MHDSNDARKASRFPLALRATVGDGLIETQASSVDVSSSGIAITSDVTWQPGSRVTLRLRLRDGRSAVARARVERSEYGLMGLSLAAVGPSFSKLLAATLFPESA